jgi:hypothetical protein
MYLFLPLLYHINHTTNNNTKIKRSSNIVAKYKTSSNSRNTQT